MKKYEELYRRIRSNIESGLLKNGERLLSIREEAAVSSVSVNTVINAYNLLADEGLIRSRERGGYYVSTGGLSLVSDEKGAVVANRRRYTAASGETGERLDQLYERFIHIDSSFACAAPGRDILPGGYFRQASARLSNAWMDYDHPEGDFTLRRRIAIAHQEWDGDGSPDDIVITNGATEALTIVLRTLLRPGDTVALESPTYMNFFRQLAPLGVKIVEIPVGSDGIDLAILEEELERHNVRMIIVQPNVQNPTGITMSDPAKERLLSLAEKAGVWLVQDDVFGDLHFGPFRPVNLSAVSDYPGLILISSSSKSIAPGLRVGWIRSSGYSDIFAEEKLRLSMDTCRMAQSVLAGFVGSTAYRRHLRSIRTALKNRIEDHIQFLSSILPTGSSVRRPDGGTLLWIELPREINATEVFEKAAVKGLIAAPGALFSASNFYRHCIRLNAGSRLTRERAEILSILGRSIP